MYCTFCGRQCDTTRINYGPETRDDVAAGRDNYGTDDVSSCCEAPVTKDIPLVGKLQSAIDDPANWDVPGLLREAREALQEQMA